MCGRYATTRRSDDLAAFFEAYDDTAGVLVPDYNVAPTDPVPIVRMSARRSGREATASEHRSERQRARSGASAEPSSDASQRVVAVARWGLVPPWATDPRAGARMINARAETVAESRAFGTSFARRRCLVPADGWYEWVRRDSGGPPSGKQAYFMTAPDGAPLVFAGIWTVWGDGPAQIMTCSIVTAPAVGDLALVHDRMPLVLPASRRAAWLVGPPDPQTLLAPTPEDFVAGLEIRPVGPAVGDVRNDGPSLVSPVTAPPLGAPAGDIPLALF